MISATRSGVYSRTDSQQRLEAGRVRGDVLAIDQVVLESGCGSGR